MKLVSAMGLSVANVEIAQFRDRKTLIVERFDRLWTKDGRLLVCLKRIAVRRSPSRQAGNINPMAARAFVIFQNS